MKKGYIKEIEKYKDYPEGSLSKKTFDRYFLPFKDFLEKYYKDADLKWWKFWTEKFVQPIFTNNDYDSYLNFLKQAQPPFSPDRIKALSFYSNIKGNSRFDNETKQFFSFLYSIDFFGDLEFEEWLNVEYWQHPWFKEDEFGMKSINHIIDYRYGDSYLKDLLVNIPKLNY